MQGEQEGIVIAVENGLAKVKTSRHSDCENCGSCPGNAAMVLDALNQVGAKPGQRVLVEVAEVSMLKSAFVVYIVPLVAIFVGTMVGGYLGEYLDVSPGWFQVGGAIFAFAGSVLYIKKVDRSAKQNSKMQPVVKRILTD
ncbi:MAG: positive regulator of sigma RseC/MucC [Firmicutes bacterium]|nr:positive regulator of sigma RseC/MucC [Bacillota bacterium]